MSFINQQSVLFVPASENVSLAGSLIFNGSIDSHEFTTTGFVELAGTLSLSGTIGSYSATNSGNAMHGNLGISGTINSSGFAATGNLQLAGSLGIAGTIASFAKVPLIFPDPILIELEENAFSAKSFTARAKKGGTEIPIKGFTVSARRDSIGKKVSLDLATKDLAVADLDASYSFEIGKADKSYDLPEWVNILSNARLDSRNYQTAWLNDSLSFGINAPLSDKLGKFPKKNIFVSDPDKIEANSTAEIEELRDTNGNLFIQEERFIRALSIYDIFQIAFVEGCGFSSFKTNIPDFEIARCDFTVTNSFYNSVKGFIGIFEPEFFARGNVLWIVDKTQTIPDEFAPVALAPEKYLNWKQTVSESAPIDGFLLSFVESKKNSNYFTIRTDVETVKTGSDIFAIGYSEVEFERKYREYRSNFKPDLILKTEQVSEKRTVKTRDESGLNVIREDETLFTYDSRGRITRAEKTESAPVWEFVSGFGWSKSLTPQILRVDISKSKYGANPENPRKTIRTGASQEITSILVSDSDNQFLGRDFRQQYIESVHAGNLNEDQNVSLVLEPVKTVIEKLKQKSGQVRTERIEIDHLLDEVTDSISDVQNGDGSNSNFESKQGNVVIFKTGLSPSVRTGNGLEALSVGELDLEYAEPLATRLLDRRVRRLQSGSIELLGFDESIEQGVYFRVLDRNGDSLGTFCCVGYTVTGENLGTRDQRIATVIDVLEV